MKKRILSLFMVLVMVLSMLSGFTFPESNGDGTEAKPYQIGDAVANDGSAEPEGYIAPDSYWARSDIPASEKLVCELHDHAVADCEPVYESVECALEDHPTEGEFASFTHEDGSTCSYDAESGKWMFSLASGYACDEEAHTHSVEAGCIEQTPAYTLWTLTENINENDNEDDKEKDKGGLMYAPAPRAADNEGRLPIHFFLASPGNITNPDGSYVNYYVPLQDSNNDAWTIPNIEKDANWGQINTENGIRNVYDESIVTDYVQTWPGDAATFKKFGSVTINGRTYSDTEYEIKWVSIMCRDNGDGLNCRQLSYSSKHIHIDGLLVEKVQPGEMEVYKAIPATAVSQTSATTFQFKLEKMLQSSLTSPPTSANAVDGNFTPLTLTATIPAGKTEAKITGGSEITFGYYKLTENSSNDWQMSGVKLTDNNNRTQTIKTDALYICIAPNGTVQYSTSPSGPYTVMKKVTVNNERKPVTVTYQWNIYDEHGALIEALPESVGAHGLPAPATNVQIGTDYVYNTGYVEGTSYHDYENGLLYTFHGWDTYSNSSVFNADPTMVGYTALDDGDDNARNNKKIPITADTWINGYWTVSELPPAAAYLMVHKDVVVQGGDADDAKYVNDYLRDIGRMFISVDPGIDKDGDGKSQIDVDYPGAVTDGGYRINVYQYEKPFEFSEHQAEVPGYKRTVDIKVTGSNLTMTAEAGDQAKVTISEEYGPEDALYNLGTVTYINTYTKNVGTAVAEYPTLSLVKRATDTGLLQANAEFTVYSDAACEDDIASFTTNSEGVADIDFKTIIGNQTGTVTVYMKETAAPDGYLVDSTVYTITLTPSASEELRGDEFVQVTTYALSVAVPENSSAEPIQNAADELKYSLNVFNRPIFGQVTVNKTATGLEDADKELLEATVTVHGPIVRNAQGAITSLGTEYPLTLNRDNEWTMTQAQLHIGEYLIHENLAYVHGYTWDVSKIAYGSLETEVYNNITSGVFEITDTDTDIEITIANTYEKWDSAGFEIYKVDPNGVHLSDVSFQLYYNESCAEGDEVTDTGITTSAVTGANGVAWFGGFTVPADDADDMVTYYLKETETQAGYYLSNTVYRVDIKAVTKDGITSFEPKISVKLNGKWEPAPGFSNTSDVLTVVNSPVLGQITIKKTMNGAPADLNSVSFYVYGPDDYAETVELTKADEWTTTLTDLHLGEYTIIEQNADAPGYDLVTTYKVGETETGDKATVVLSETNPGKTASNTVFVGTAEIINTYTRRETTIENPASLIVKKVDENNKALADAEFTLVRDRDGAKVSYTTDADGKVTFSFLHGTIENGQAIEGTYTLTETKAPEGYAATDTEWEIIVKENDGKVTIVLNEDTNIFENIWDWIVGKDEDNGYNLVGNELTVVNYELADLTISKSFEDGVEVPEGAIIEVAVFDSNGALVEEVELSANNDADKNWKYTLNDLPAGEYTIREISPSLHGYTWQEAEFTVNGETSETATANSVTVDVENSEDVTVNITNTYAQWQAVDFYVMKVGSDGVSPLAGAKFKLEDENGNDVTTLRLCKNEAHINNGNETANNGVLHFNGFTVPADDEDGKIVYKLTEIQTPVNYYPNGNVYYITISHNNNEYDIDITADVDGNVDLDFDNHSAHFNHANDVLTVVNEEILADLVIEKTFPGSDLVPLSVKVDITGPNGYSNTVTLGTHNHYKLTLEGLSLGDYTIKEQDASQNGYALTVKYNGQIQDQNQLTIKLTKDHDNAAAKVEIQNTYLLDKHNPASFTVKKVDSEDATKLLEGAVFGLYDSTGALVGEEKTTDANGEVTFGPFTSAAEYTLKEISAPVNYEASTDSWTVKVTLEGGQVKVELNENKNLYENIYDWIVDVVTGQTQATWKDGVLTVPNTIKTGTLTITKEVVDSEGHYAGKEYSFTLNASDDEFDEEFTLKAEEGYNSYTIENIPYGTTYTLTENTTGAAFVSSITDKLEGKIEAAETAIEVTNTYNYRTDNPGLNLVKVDADKTDLPLAKAGFTLYSDKECKTAVGSEVFSNEAGKIHLDIAEAGTYYLKETTAPEGYYLDETVYTVTVKESEELKVENAGTATASTVIQMLISIEELTASDDGSYTIKNTAIKDVEISVRKIWYGAGVTHPESVKVVLYRDGKEYDSVTLSEKNKWTYTWTGLTDEYEWTVDEPSVPSGYVKTVTVSGEYDFYIINTLNDIPKTGDSTNLFGLGLMFVLGLAGFGTTATMLLRPKKNKSGK